MNRREFLKALGFSAAALALPIDLVKAYPHFNPKTPYGAYIEVSDFIDRGLLQVIIKEVMNEQIAETIPPGWRGHIRYRIIQPGPASETDPLGQIGKVVWKYYP